MSVPCRSDDPGLVAPDAEAIDVFVRTVLDGLEGFVPVRVFTEKGGAPVRSRLPFERIGGNLTERLHGHAVDACRQGAGLFVVPGATAVAGSARAEDITQLATIVVDLDEGNIDHKVEVLSDLLGPPTLEVASGGITKEEAAKRHLYWRLNKVARGEDLCVALEGRAVLAKQIGGDTAFASAHQPIRVAGSVYCKHGDRRPVRVIAHRKTAIDLFEVANAVRAIRPLTERSRDKVNARTAPAERGPSARELLKLTVREDGIDGITRFEAVGKVIGHYLREARLGRLTNAEAWEHVQSYNTERLRPPFADERLWTDFDRILLRDRAGNNQVAARATAPEAEGAAPEASEDALARAFTALHGSTWRYIAAWGCWYRWDQKVWRHDQEGRARELVRRVCRRQAAGLADEKLARKIASNATVQAAERLARHDPQHTSRSDQWDVDPWLLNARSGILALRTGEISEHSPDAMMTKITTAKPGGACPRWDQFLGEITAGDEAFKRYLARLAGYCLTGVTTEHVVFFLFGNGANGKSVFIDVISSVLGNYATAAARDTFVSSRSEQHPTGLAALQGARLITVTETEAGRHWALGRLKAFAGGDTIAARFMHRDYFEFRPVGKLVFAGNHKPALTSFDEAIRRRIHIVPFGVVIPPKRRDKDLTNRLLAERDGILSWMLEGLADWRKVGLSPPAAVQHATHEYFIEEDVVGRWLEEECEQGNSLTELSSRLFASWQGRAKAIGEDVRSQKWLSGELQKRGFTKSRIGSQGARGFQGLAVRGRSSTPREVGP